jgi:pimeloyl-ACP methyl ester carboxylesterase
LRPVKSTLLLHGAGGGGWEWNLWRDVFAARNIRVSAPDLQPAAGGLPATTLDDYVAQAREVLHALPHPRALVGASLGGLLAVVIAEAADALVLINPLPVAPFHRVWPRRRWPEAVPWRRDARLASTRRAMPDADDAAALYAFRRWRDESGTALRTAQAGIATVQPRCPVLCIVSEQDEDVPAAATLALAAAWRTDLIRMPSAGHLAPLLGRNAVEVARQSLAWLSAR